MWRAFFRFLLSVFVVAGCSFSLPSRAPSPAPSQRPVQEDPEVKISRDFRREAKKAFKLIHDPEVERYVDQVGQRILSAMGPQPYDYRFFVVEDSQLNAFAIPGGSIYVHTGLLERISNTDELAGVLGHEITHIKGHHMARLSGPDPLSLLALLGMFLGKGGAGAQAAGAAAQALSAARELSYSRGLEQEADNLGIRYMAEAGYNPKEVLNFLKIMDQERILNPTDVPPYLMTHPVTQERMANAALVVRNLNLGPAPQRFEQADPIKKIQTILRLERHESSAVIAANEKLLSQNPENAEAMHLLGVAYYYNGRWQQARENFERARARRPDSPGIDRDLGRLYTQIGEFGLAHQAFDRSLNLHPQEPLNYLFLGDLYEKESNLREAASAFFRAHTLWPAWAEPLYRLGYAYNKMDRPGDAYYNLGRSELLQDEDKKAIADFERAIKIFGPNSPQGQSVKDELEAIKARGK